MIADSECDVVYVSDQLEPRYPHLVNVAVHGSRAPGLLLADIESADSLGSLWMVSNRAAARDVLS
jgi:hypothetical protein